VRKVLSGLYIVLAVMGGMSLIASIPAYSLLGREVAVELVAWGASLLVAIAGISILVIWKKVSDEAVTYPLLLLLILGTFFAVLTYVLGVEQAMLGVYGSAVGLVVTVVFRFTPTLFKSGQEPSL
jgi:hypothetical protein